jgi:hypothetical protein
MRSSAESLCQWHPREDHDTVAGIATAAVPPGSFFEKFLKLI